MSPTLRRGAPWRSTEARVRALRQCHRHPGGLLHRCPVPKSLGRTQRLLRRKGVPLLLNNAKGWRKDLTREEVEQWALEIPCAEAHTSRLTQALFLKTEPGGMTGRISAGVLVRLYERLYQGCWVIRGRRGSAGGLRPNDGREVPKDGDYLALVLSGAIEVVPKAKCDVGEEATATGAPETQCLSARMMASTPSRGSTAQQAVAQPAVSPTTVAQPAVSPTTVAQPAASPTTTACPSRCLGRRGRRRAQRVARWCHHRQRCPPQNLNPSNHFQIFSKYEMVGNIVKFARNGTISGT